MERCGFCLVIKIPQVWPMYKVLISLDLNVLWTCVFGTYTLILSMLFLFQLQTGLVLLRLQYVIPAQHIPVLLPSAAGAVDHVPSAGLQHLWALGRWCWNWKQRVALPCTSSALPLQTVEEGLETGLQILSDKLLTNFRSNFPWINCHSDKQKRHCHVSTRWHREKNHKGIWSTWIL